MDNIYYPWFKSPLDRSKSGLMDKTAQNSNKDSLLFLLWPVNMTGE